MTKAVVLLSGGADSATVLALAKAARQELYALTFSYGQRHSCELTAARRVADAMGAVAHNVVDFDMRQFGGSALTSDLPVPKNRSMEVMAHDIPVTYVPARNTIFLSFALAWSEIIHAKHIYIGVNALDYSGYPDCRSKFIAAYQCMAETAIKGAAPTICAPLLYMTKAEILAYGLKLGVDYGLTHSCYDPVGELACGACDACVIRLAAFATIGVRDPARYV